jgi:hypothetical protein
MDKLLAAHPIKAGLILEAIVGLAILLFCPCKSSILDHDSVIDRDWSAYMEQIDVYRSGDKDYINYEVRI